MSEATTVRFLLDDKVHEVRDVEPTTTVLNYLRERINRTGTKEGCAEGDCGACTVVIAELRDDKIRARSVNACIQFLPTLDGKALFTVESLKSAMNNRLHPAQQAMVDCHGSQCGFCTPGFVMSLFGLYKNNPHPTRQQIDDALAGNLCRCTGYRPIIAAAHKMYEYSKHLQKDVTSWAAQPCGSDDKRGEQELMKQLRTIQRTTRLSVSAKFRYFAPTSADDLAKLALEHPDATILAGGTDVGLWVTKLHKDLLRIIYIGDVKALDAVNVSDTHIEIGAAVNLTDAYEKIIEYYPDLEEIYRRFGSPPIRNAGTLVGNIANGSPIGDSMPALICLGASIVLRKGKATRELALHEFYLGYQQKTMEPGEFVESTRIPLPMENTQFRTYKISKRFDQDISAVCGAFSLALDNNTVHDIRICYGGMAATPKRALQCENTIKDRKWNEATVDAAVAALALDYKPLNDMRASAEYRILVAANLLRKFFIDTTEVEPGTYVREYGT